MPQLLMLTVLSVARLGCALPQYQQPTTTTPPPPPVPFKYAFEAGRVPGGAPDRYVEQEGDDKGVIRGSYSYLDPNWEWQKVAYVADENGFHVDASNLPVANPVAHPQDTFAVAKAKANHEQLYEEIAIRNSQVPVDVPNVDTPVVANKKAEFADQFAKIQAEHQRIAEEHRALAEQREREQAALHSDRHLLETAVLSQ